MPGQTKLKAAAEGYHPQPFFFIQRSHEDVRLLAWTPHLTQLKELVYKVLETFPESVEVLLKVQQDGGDDGWKRFTGQVFLDQLIQVICAHEPFVFQDGWTQLCVRRADTGEYIALDDHGILFIYSERKEYEDICRNKGFGHKLEELIYERGHWHIHSKVADQLQGQFIRELSLQLLADS